MLINYTPFITSELVANSNTGPPDSIHLCNIKKVIMKDIILRIYCP